MDKFILQIRRKPMITLKLSSYTKEEADKLAKELEFMRVRICTSVGKTFCTPTDNNCIYRTLCQDVDNALDYLYRNKEKKSFRPPKNSKYKK